jgi:beta-galactosidase
VYIVRRVGADTATPSDPGFNPLARRQTQFADWTPRNSAPHEEDVEVYSNCELVELLLNGKSLGAEPLPTDASPRSWKVPYAPGALTAMGRDHGAVVAGYELHTAGKPAKIHLLADRPVLTADWDDVSYVEAAVVDSNGVIIPDATNMITFKLSGPGSIAAVDSGDNSSHESFRGNERRAYQGHCFAIIKATEPSGKIKLSASAPGLAGGKVEIKASVPKGGRQK